MQGNLRPVRVNNGGNYCGHDPQSPQFTLRRPIKLGKGGLPRVITLAVERLSRYYFTPSLLPSLNHANGSDRQQRSERRESCVIVLSLLLKHMDLTSLRVGVPTANGFFNMSIEWLAGETLLSFSRVKMALADLRASGILTSSQARIKNSDGTYSGQNSVKAIGSSLFKALGLGKMLDFERKKASKRLTERLEKEQRKTNLSGQGRTSLYLQMLSRRTAKKPQAKVRKDHNAGLTMDQRRHLSCRVMELKTQNPSLDRDELYRRAKTELGIS